MIHNDKMKITITGATGFVGLNLQAYLKPSYDVSSISVRYLADQQIDLKADAIIHLAGKAHDLKNVSVPKDYYDANFELTKQLFDAFLLSDAKVFVFMSTVKAVADEVNEMLTEDAIPNPKTHYGIAKQQAEQYILSKEKPAGKRVYILRPCMIHGPGNKGNLNLLYQLVAKVLPWPLGSFENKRSFLSIENLCFVIKELLDNIAIPSGIYNVADDELISTNSLINFIAVSQNKKSRILKINKSLIIFIAKIGDFFRLPFNSERLHKLTENYEVSNVKIKSVLGKSLPLSSEQGFVKTFQSFKLNE